MANPSSEYEPRVARLLTAAYYLVLVILGLTTAAEGPSLPSLAAHTSSTLDRIGLLFVADSFGYLAGSLAGGRLYDRVPGHKLMAGMLVVMAGAAVAIPLAPVLWWLLLLAMILGLGKGAVDAGSNTLLQWVHGARVGPYMNGLHFCYGLGSLLAPLLLARIISSTHDIYWVFWSMSIVIMPLAVWLWLLPAPARPRQASTGPAGAAPFVPVMLIVLAFVFYVGAELGFSSWIYTYALKLGLGTAVTAAYLTSAYWAMFTAGRLIGIWVSTKLRSRTILFIDFAGCLLSLALIGLARESVWALWIGSMSLGLFTASVFPTLIILAGERLQVSGTVTGLFLVGAGAGGMLLPWVIGIAFTAVSPYAMVTMLFASTALGLITILLFVYGQRAAAQPLALDESLP